MDYNAISGSDMPRKDCPQCEGTGWKPMEIDGVRRVTRCDCYDVERAELLLRQAHIPERYENCAFENFDIRRDNQSLRWAKLNAENFVKEYPTDFGLLFVGTTGAGKTRWRSFLGFPDFLLNFSWFLKLHFFTMKGR